MTLSEVVYTVLHGSAGIVAIVGTRITPGGLPQNQGLPAITYEPTGGNVAYAFGVDPNIVMPRVTVNCWANSYSAVETLAKLVRAVFRNHQGTHTDADSTITVQGSLIEFEPFYLFEPDVRLHRMTTDITVHYSEA